MVQQHFAVVAGDQVLMLRVIMLLKAVLAVVLMVFMVVEVVQSLTQTALMPQ
jgi:antibiotic biosynthesis monooxygenase (ABM) superfamily enzyme|tara:strand:- start:493 stop:648 length:156 start_codon:yes stop_codon:yes gene_type:complete